MKYYLCENFASKKDKLEFLSITARDKFKENSILGKIRLFAYVYYGNEFAIILL